MAGVLRQRLGAFERGFDPSSLRCPVYPPFGMGKRFMGGHGVDDAEETFQWRNITIAAVMGCMGTVFNTFSGEEHHHPEDRPAYSYLRIRNKAFPWGPNGLFESDD
ncbi:cytochrome c oxidase subunit 6a, mitochondrial [Physcomitrium patens]|uniref:Uncharacterized protein n=1 Tax=Physcomitrium patens TaxID=3218 RepID=A0A2K1JM14_PHYPA|nr:cytochrome c oxidase subunit 6a, mitochondrial-like isoform X2 [Physcomitrium patens]PNR42578.1 hypothetical protein PHYPA_017408 [Physcomitrium patens]|eukprot:XP_024393108.1 cytochrome c oxidase subunit 6a, mitochondrial-like isoform X2 [Physcomitrella patens]